MAKLKVEALEALRFSGVNIWGDKVKTKNIKHRAIKEDSISRQHMFEMQRTFS